MRTEVAALALVLVAALTAQAGGPAPADLAILRFLAGDLRGAQEACVRAPKVDRRCQALRRPLAEYAYLAGERDHFTPAQVREYLALDARLSPKARGKLTEATWQRFVAEPLDLARQWAQAGQREAARKKVQEVLEVAPGLASARTLLAELKSPLTPSPDGGAALR